MSRKKISSPTKTTPGPVESAPEFSLEQIMAGLDVQIEKNVPLSHGDLEADAEDFHAQERASTIKAWVNEPIMDITEIEPERELQGAVAALGDRHASISEADLTAQLYAFTEQDREKMVYGVNEMENPPSEVAACFGTTEQVVLLAIRMDAMARAHHAEDVLRT
jgi:hypothetical protein